MYWTQFNIDILILSCTNYKVFPLLLTTIADHLCFKASQTLRLIWARDLQNLPSNTSIQWHTASVAYHYNHNSQTATIPHASKQQF